MATSSVHELKIEPYVAQKKKFWPKEGRHILAQYDEDSVVVYQAFNPIIAEYAVKHQRFGGSSFSFGRMSWIKPNFLWMMYRCGWASKEQQERVLAVRITREGFDEILASAYTAQLQKSKKLTNNDIMVRLQWDPDHTPDGGKETRRAIQLGLKGQILEKYGTQWVKQIDDVTEFVKEQQKILQTRGEDDLHTPSERVYALKDQSVAYRIQLDFFEDHHRHAVVVGGEQSVRKHHEGTAQGTGAANVSEEI